MRSKPESAENSVAQSSAEVEPATESEHSSPEWDDYLEGLAQAIDLYPDESDGRYPQSDLLMLYMDGLKVQNDLAIAWKKLLVDEHLD